MKNSTETNMRGSIKHRKAVSWLLPVLALTLLLAGCGSDNGDYSKYVTLGDYQNLEVTKSVEPVTDQEVEAYEKEQLADYVDYQTVDGPVKEGQLVSVALVAKENDETVYDFSDDGYELTVGEKEFGEEVDEALLGAVVSDEIDLDVSYDKNFEDAMLAGKDINYHIEVQSISDMIYPELTDEFVKEKFGVQTVDAWRQSLEEQLEKDHETEAEDTMREDLARAAVDACTVNGYPKQLYKKKKQALDADYQNYADMFSCSLDDVYQMLDMDEQAREQECVDTVNQTMVLSEIRKQENLTLTDGQLTADFEAYAKENDYDSVDALLADYDKEDLTEYFLNEMTIDFLEEHAKITQETATE